MIALLTILSKTGGEATQCGTEARQHGPKSQIRYVRDVCLLSEYQGRGLIKVLGGRRHFFWVYRFLHD